MPSSYCELQEGTNGRFVPGIQLTRVARLVDGELLGEQRAVCQELFNTLKIQRVKYYSNSVHLHVALGSMTIFQISSALSEH